jgi:hypothetical protein
MPSSRVLREERFSLILLVRLECSTRSKNRVPEESIGTPGPNDDAIRRLERRLEAFELAAQTENRWWRGGLIAALVLLAFAILVAAHHRHRAERFMLSRMGSGQMAPGQMGMPGPEWQGQGPRMMPYGPPPPPNWGYGPGPQGGYGEYYGPPPWARHHHHDDDGQGGPDSEQPPPPKG